MSRNAVVRGVVAGTLAVAVSAMLVVTIYFTRLDLEWLTFLGGVLFAAVVALASQVSRAEWLAARRAKQLGRYKQRLSEAQVTINSARETARQSDARVQLVLDALPDLVLYMDHEMRCRYHNRAAARWIGLSAQMIYGQSLGELLGVEVNKIATAYFQRGIAAEYELALHNSTAARSRFEVRQVPHVTSERTAGFYLILTRIPAPAAAPARQSLPATANVSKAAPASDQADSGQALYTESMTSHFVGSDDQRTRLVRALHDNEFMLFSQKIASIREGLDEPDCYEVLLRLKEEEDNMLPPGGFIPIAEHYGLMEEIDRWVVNTLVSWCIAQQARAPERRLPMFCVNLADVSIGNPAFASFVRTQLRRPGFPARALCFEIGEPELLERNVDVRNFSAALGNTGCRLTIDGFGGLKVSFAHLQGIKVDFLKLNGMMIQNLVKSPTEHAKVKGIKAVCDKMGIRTIAGFVESEETLKALHEIGIDYAQGFGIASPQPIDRVVDVPGNSAVST